MANEARDYLMHVELTKNAAELGYARFLYAVRAR